MSDVCPNCGSEDLDFLRGYEIKRLWCTDCGSLWWQGSNSGDLYVPNRSLPAEVLELPDADGQWWYYPKDGEPAVFNVKFLDSAPAQPVFCMSHNPCLKGQYVRCIPPIVKPPVRDADDEDWRDRVNHYVCESAKYSAATDSNLAKAVDALRFAVDLIAARLDRETKGAERDER